MFIGRLIDRDKVSHQIVGSDATIVARKLRILFVPMRLYGRFVVVRQYAVQFRKTVWHKSMTFDSIVELLYVL